MTDRTDPTATTGDPLDAIIADYLQCIEAGEVPDRAALLAAHPDLADRLHAFFADLDRLDRQLGDLHLSPSPDAADAGELPRVRYFGDYELLEVIARGGMGVVYKARQVSLNRLVALKMIVAGELATPQAVARFQAEAEAAACLDHPHIVPIYEVGEHEGQQYYAMRYVEGPSLARRPRDDARTEARRLAVIARAVHHAHQRGILHRDLKPSNILLEGRAEDVSPPMPLVADFGLSKRIEGDRSLTETGALVGTPRYMAPEQAAGRKDLTVAADVYSLGVVLYERLTGQTPFTGETVLEVLLQVRGAEVPRPSGLVRGLSRDLETICLKCLEKDPGKRYGSAAELADDLERWLEGRPIQARPVGRTERLWRWCRRNPAVAALTAAVILALLSGTVVSTWFAVEANARAEAERIQRDRADNRTREVEEAGEQLERTLARSLMRPLLEDATGEVLTDAESEALWELAESPSERLRNWFVSESLTRPLSTAQLIGRSEAALIAAVGLDEGRRAPAERALVERMSDDTLPLRQRADIAWVALELAEPDSPFVRQAGELIARAIAEEHDKQRQAVVRSWMTTRQVRLPLTIVGRLLAEALAKETDPLIRQSLAAALSAVAGRLPPDQAARLLAEALAKETNPGARCLLAAGLSVVAGRLPPDQAAAVCAPAARLLAEAINKETNPNHRVALAAALSAVAGRLPPDQATHLLAEALAKETNPSARRSLAENLSAVAGRLPPDQAAAVCGPAAGLLAEALAKETNAGHRVNLAAALSAVAGRLPPDQTAAVCAPAARLLAEAINKETNPYAHPSLAEALSAVAGRLSPDQAAAVCRSAARLLAEAIDKETNPYLRPSLAEALSAVAGRLSSDQAAAVCRSAARLLAEALAKETNAGHRGNLAAALSAVAGRLPPDQAAAVCAPAARLLAEVIDKETNADARWRQAVVLSKVAERLPPDQAIRLLIEALAKETNELACQQLAAGLSAVAERLPPDQAACLLVEAIAKDTNPLACSHLAAGLVIVTDRIEQAETDRVCEQALALMQQREVSVTNWSERMVLQGAASVLVQRLAGEKAHRMALQQACRIAAAPDANLHRLYPRVPQVVILDRLLSEESRPQRQRGAVATATTLGLAGGGPLPALAALPSAAEPLPCRLTTPELVELLKYPTCIGLARQVVLKHLGNRYGRSFANHWEFVRYANEHNLGLDFTSPPKRPPQP